LDKRRFLELWRCRNRSGDVETGDAVYGRLFSHYSQPERHYHTPAHVQHCLTQVDLVRELLDNPDAVEMALWFHDVIYIPAVGSGENEKASAEFFVECAGKGFEDDFVDRVYRLIMVTTHSETPRDEDERFMVDIDLSSFGLPWSKFSADSRNVRAEFSNVPDEEFHAKQAAFLRSLLSRERFCFTDFFHGRHEARARNNIERLLAKIAK